MNIQKNIIITGGKGVLGSFIAKLYPDDTIAVGKRELDLTKLSSIVNAINHYNPRYIINCAALTDMNFCETHPKAAYRVNSEGVTNIKLAVVNRDIKLVHISTDAAIAPISVYGKSKHLGESYLDKKDLLIRTTYFSVRSYLLNRLQALKPVEAYSNIFFKPVSILTLARLIMKSLNKNGVINIFSDTSISKFAFAQITATRLGVPLRLIRPIEYKPNAFNRVRRKTHTRVVATVTINLDKDLRDYLRFLKKND